MLRAARYERSVYVGIAIPDENVDFVYDFIHKNYPSFSAMGYAPRSVYYFQLTSEEFEKTFDAALKYVGGENGYVQVGPLRIPDILKEKVKYIIFATEVPYYK